MLQHNGLWTIRVGLFGAPDNETRGGVVVVEDGRIIGGDSNLAYMGSCTIDGSSVTGRLHLVRHGDPSFVTIFGGSAAEYDVEFVAERLFPGYYEGRLLAGPWQGRLVLRRLSDLAPKKGYEPNSSASAPSMDNDNFARASAHEAERWASRASWVG